MIQTMKVIDASAVIAFCQDEPGAERAPESFAGGVLSLINLAEVLARFARDGVKPEEVKSQVDRFGLTYAPPTMGDIFDIGRIPANLGLSLGDKFCAALARRTGAPIVTADRVFAEAGLNIPVELIR